MASIYVSDRTLQGNSSRIKCEDVDLSKDIGYLKEHLSKITNKAQTEFELVYCGIMLKEDNILDSCGLKSGSTIHMLKKPEMLSSSASSTASNSEVKNIIRTLQAALANQAYRPTVDMIVNSPDALHEIISAIPELNEDPATLAMFQDQELLKILAHPGNIRRVIEAHPSFGQTALMIAAAVDVAGKQGDFTAMTAPGSYSMDQMSDDEDLAMPGASGGSQAGTGATSRNRRITSSQLSAALAAASGSAQSSPQLGSPFGGESQPISGPLITSEFFQAAMQQAQNTGMQVPGQNTGMQSQIQQMREMGITDETVARQALQATNGNLQAALDLLFGGNF